MTELEDVYYSMSVDELEGVLARGGLTPKAELLCKFVINQKTGEPRYSVRREYGGIKRVPFLVIVLFLGVIKSHFGAITPSAFVDLSIIFVFTALRYKNIGFYPLWSLLMLVPVINLLILIQCLAYPEGYSEVRRQKLLIK